MHQQRVVFNNLKLYFRPCLKILVCMVLLGGIPVNSTANSGQAGNKVLRVAIYTYPPLVYQQNDDWGYCLEIVKAIFEPKGYTVIPDHFPVVRAIKQTENTHQDAICAINPFNSTKLSLASFSVAKLTYSFWVRESSSFKYTGVKSLKKQQLLNIVGYNYSLPGKEYQDYLANPDNEKHITQLTGSDPLLRAFKMIASNRADSICLDDPSANFTLKANYMTPLFKKAGSLPNVLYAYFGVSQKHAEKKNLLDIYNKGFLKLYESRVIHTILEKYDVSPWPLSDGHRPSE